jgi:hypothetical protein
MKGFAGEKHFAIRLVYIVQKLCGGGTQKEIAYVSLLIN